MKRQTPIADSPCSTITMRKVRKDSVKQKITVRPKNKQTEPVFEAVFSHPRRIYLFLSEDSPIGS